ncbi:hypothetical protein [Phenylobacterium aquaticum]|nr:hypothetical protein [Phenylobacterium aquaticum]
MTLACPPVTPRPVKGLAEKIAFWTILAFLLGLPIFLEVMVALRTGFQ